MRLVGLMFVRNEQWVLGCSLPAALRLVDEVVVLDHASTDRTPAIVAEVAAAHPGRVHVIDWTEPEFNETDIRQRLLDEGRARGGTHFMMLDADEIVTAQLLDELRERIADLPPAHGLELPWLAMWQSLDRYRDDDSVWSDNVKLFCYADAPALTHRALDDGYHLHLQTPRGLVKPHARPYRDADGGVMHLQFANRRRLVAKHVWYKMFETIRFPGRTKAAQIDRTYSQALDETALRTSAVPAAWWSAHAADRDAIDVDDRPWQEDAILGFLREHGREAFAGLELWGLPERLLAEAGDAAASAPSPSSDLESVA